jgi:hypothetical protein
MSGIDKGTPQYVAGIHMPVIMMGSKRCCRMYGLIYFLTAGLLQFPALPKRRGNLRSIQTTQLPLMLVWPMIGFTRIKARVESI